MTQHPIQAAALDAADRIMDMVARWVPEPERAALWGRLFAEIQAGIVAAVGREDRERFEPGRN